MKLREITILSLVVFLAMFGCLLAAETLPDTGQTKFYNNSDEISEPAPGTAFYGQDAHYRRIRSYTRLDADGSALPDSVANCYMLRDNITGLIWECKQNGDGFKDYTNPHDSDNVYTWYDSNPVTNGGNAGVAGDGTDTEDFLKIMNSGSGYCGFTDWRLPTIKELSQIADPSLYGQDICSPEYFSSTTDANISSLVWVVCFGDGFVWGEAQKSSNYHVRAVRSSQTHSLKPLIMNGDGTVTDPNTGLMWQQAEPGTMDWENALKYCEELVLPDGGYDDWRLPDRFELQSLVDYNLYTPCLDKIFFPGILSYCYYWSSTTVAYNAKYAWLVDFSFGGLGCAFATIYEDGDLKTDSFYVRAVRSAHSGLDNVIISSFTSTPSNGHIPLNVVFSCVANDLDGGSIVEYRWDFNSDGVVDNTTSTGEITHNFVTVGNYEISCIVVNDKGQTSEALVSLVVTGDKANYVQGSYNYYIPYFHSNPNSGYWTGLGLANAKHDESAQLLVSVFNNNGNLLAANSKTMPAYGQNAFPVAPELDDSGWILVNSHKPLYGVAFLGSGGANPLIADVPFISELTSCLMIPYIAQDSVWDTTVLICNPNNYTAFISIRFFDKAGVEQGSQDYTIPAQGSEEYPLSTVFKDALPLTGMIVINSSTCIAAFALYTDQKGGGTYYAGINAEKSVELSDYESVINFSGQSNIVEVDSGSGVFSGVPINTTFFGYIDAVTANGKISDGSTMIPFSCCLAAGGLSISNNSVLSPEKVASLNALAGTNMFNAGELVDIVNIEGDATTSGGGRVEVGLSYIFAASTFSDTSLSNYPFDPNDVLLDLFFIYEEDVTGGDIYSAMGQIN